ncbi:hypothetical protein PVAND_012630 [Polypedilum vanderplanki]|uniref:Glucose-methanol-choline oxidoreductase N-terminal domain-containing protein n=1 Tax=Polypedilum vanderplanki TaxID=319348 RepID=A0A9J6CN21_POLVA|nr:hypothetical protein PVAND_012630 [Polypedilum vanderplanki]
MNFLPDSTILSAGTVFVLTTLLSNFVNNPEYQWPLDYLTSESYCRSSICEQNACLASMSNSLPQFDYIIVGSGPAGSVIAYRLTQQFPDRKVLLIESGGEPLVNSIVPKMWAFNLNTTVAHKYFAEKSFHYSKAFKTGTDCMSGNQIGGSTGMNAMMYHCGNDRDYNDWAGITNDRSWNYENMLPLIKRTQNNQDPKLTYGKCAAYHGTDGPLVVSSSDYDLYEDNLLPILKSIIKEGNIRELEEINCGPPYTGFTHIQSTVNNGERESAARAFLVPIKDFPNFYLMKESFVDKIYFKKQNGNLLVKGVNVLTKQPSCSQITLQAKREVILSAGAYGSPQILLRSGIGRENDLKKCKIPQIIDLPVGYHLSDHFMTLHLFLLPDNQTSTPEGAQAFFSNEGGRFFTQRSGFFTTSGLNHHWFINTKDSNSDYPDVQIIFGLLNQNLPDFDVIFKDKYGFKDEFANPAIEANKHFSIIQVAIVLLHPESEGKISLRHCNDPYSPPIIDANYLSTEKDVETVVSAINILNEFMNSNAAKNAGIRQVIPNLPECDCYPVNSECYSRCYIRFFSQNLWHPTGSCRMGFSSADNVVDSKLKVFGVERSFDTPMLRVADASCLPSMPSGNTQCPVYAIGEKAAEMIISDNF